MDSAYQKMQAGEACLVKMMERSSAFESLEDVFAWCFGDAVLLSAPQDIAMRFDTRRCEGSMRLRGTHAKLALLVSDMRNVASATAASVLEAISQHSYGMGQWLKVAGGAKANLIESSLRTRPGKPGEVALECGVFVGFTTIRIGQRDLEQKAAAENPRVPGVVGLEVEPVHVCVARWMVNLAKLSAVVEVWAGIAHDSLFRAADEFGPRSVRLVFMDHGADRSRLLAPRRPGFSSSRSSFGEPARSGEPSSLSLRETAETGSFAKVLRRIMNAGQSLAGDAAVSPTPSASAAPWASATPHGQSAPSATASVSYAAFVSSIVARGGRADPKTLPGSEETSSWAPSSPPQVRSSGSNQPSSVLPLRSPSPPQAEGTAGALRTPTSMSLMFLKRKEDDKMKMEEMFVKMKEEDLEAKRRKLNQKFEDKKAAPSTPTQADTSGASECPTPPAVHCSTMDDIYEFASTCPNARKAFKWMGVTSVLDLACMFSSEADLRFKLQKCDEPEDIVCNVIRTWKLARTNEEYLIESASTRLQTRASRSARPEPASVVSLRKTRKGLHGPPELDNRLSRTTVLPLSKAAVVQNDRREEHLSLMWSLFAELGDRGLRRSAAVLEDADAAKPGFMRNFREFDEGQLRSKLSVLKRWQRWYEARQPRDQPYWLTSANAVSAFLASVNEGGPTASSGVYQGLLWWSTYVGIPFHLSDPSVCSFKTKDAGHSEEPVPPIDVMTFDRMLSLSLALQGSISIFAGCVILMLSACLRFARLQRSTLLRIQDGCLVGTCSRGKRRVAGVRPPFDWATPLVIQPGRNPFAQILLMHSELRQRMGCEPAFAIPDMAIVNGRLSASSAILPKPMSLPKFTEIFQSLLRGFQLPEKQILSFASYSLRRFLPTLADIFMMEPEHRAAIGNWIETPNSSAASSGSSTRPKAQLTMAQRYSQDKCITAGYVKQRALVMLSMAQSELKITGATWSQLRTVAPAYDDVTREMRHPAWRPEEKPAVETAAAEAVDEDTVSGATSSDNAEPSTGDEEEPITTTSNVLRFAQTMSSCLHLVQRVAEHGALVPWCRNSAFKGPHITRGTGLSKTSGEICAGCFQRAPLSVVRAVRIGNMMAIQVRKQDELRQALKEAAVEDEICAYMSDVLKMTSIEDFVRFVSEAAYETELLTHILGKVASFKSDLLQLSRLRTAWRTEQRRIAGQGAEDMDEPLDASMQDSLLKQWVATYSQNLAAWLHPADSLLGRIYREFQTVNTPTVISIKEVKSLLIASRPSSEREVNLGGNVKPHLSDGAADGLSIASCVDYYWGLRILGYAHSIVGQYKTSSTQTPGAQVVYAPLSVNMDYADLCLKRSQVWQGGQRRGDERETSRAHGMGWPQGEALQKALTEMELQWTVGPVASQKRAVNESAGGGREEEAESLAKKVRTATTFQSAELCKKWNDQRGCPGEKEPALRRSAHRDSAILPVDLALAGWSHGDAARRDQQLKHRYLGFETYTVVWEAPAPSDPLDSGDLSANFGDIPLRRPTIYTVAILSDDCARETSMRYLKNVVHVKDAETMTGPLLRSFLRVFPDGCPILVGGTCPWSGRVDMRPTVFSEVPRIACEIEAELVALKQNSQVVKFVENTWATDDGFEEEARKYFQGDPVRTQAGEFGYLGRKGNMATIDAKMPVGVTLVEEKGIVRLVWQGKKPMPEKFQADGYFDLAFKPEDVMRASGKGAMATLGQEFRHPAVNLDKLTQGALHRFDADGRRFPALSYEPQSLLWSKLATWRPPCPTERASLMMLPLDAVAAVGVDSGKTAPQREARQNNLVGNSFHIPSLMMVLILLFQTVQTKGNQLPDPTWAHLGLEFDLRQSVRGTVWQPGLVETWPELIEPTTLVASMHELFLSQGLQLDHAVQARNVPAKAVALLQSYWVDTQMRKLPRDNQGIDWSMQRNKPATAMGLGSQRGGPHCAGTLPALVERGVGKVAHMAFALPLPSPFDSENVMDDDALYAARAMARLGPYVRIWQRRMKRALEALAKAFQPWDDLLVNLLDGRLRLSYLLRL
ncbi:unnamed protein product [Polarella glacialis]|uniref:Dinoflagellate luciferase N-terminal domain-containing protein n=1 Tax=Polarella glacialis TaxID=89957 RepID=A0A813FEU5_POLGL|nr:unnamed protein product [Polarella glacialis]